VRRLVFLALASCTTLTTPEGATWQSIDTAGLAPRWGQTAVYDARRDRMVIFGGDGDKQRNELIALDLATLQWTTLPATNPPGPRTDLASIYDATRDRMVIVGGRVGFASSIDEVWAYAFQTATWEQLPSGPPARHDVPGTTDGTRAWVFGGAGAFLQSLDDLWELDLATNTWRELPSGDTHPSARTSGALVFYGDALYLSGGHDALAVQRDSWRYDLAARAWTKLEPTGDFVAGAHFGYALDAKCGTLRYSGGDNLDNYDTAYTVSLTLSGSPAFSVLPTSNLPPVRDHASMILDPVRHRLVLYGGGTLGDGLGTLGDAWLLDLGTGCP
jgi:hypothetical protein